MIIQFNTDKNINGDEEHELYFSARIEESLKRFESSLTRIEVHLSDVNSSKDGLNNKLCLLEARIEGMQPISVSCHADTIETSVDGALNKLKASLTTILGRLQNH